MSDNAMRTRRARSAVPGQHHWPMSHRGHHHVWNVLLLALSIVAFGPATALADPCMQDCQYSEQAAQDMNSALEREEAAQNAAWATAQAEVDPNPYIPPEDVSGSDPGAAVGVATIGLPTTGSAEFVGGTHVFEGQAWGTKVGVQPFDGGFRALIRMDASYAPERYNYPVGTDAAQLRLEGDGSVSVLNSTGGLLSHIAAPWARDALGYAVPTWYEINGLTLSQVVAHRWAGFVYPIVADPFWDTAWKVVKCAGAVGVFIAGNALLIIKVRRIGGIARAVQRLRAAGNYEARWKAALAIFGEVTGIAGIVSTCKF